MSKFEKGSMGYFLELAKKDGFDNIKDWNEWIRKKKNNQNKKVLKYNPCSKELQDDAKRFGLNGYQYMRKLVEEGKLPNPTDVERNYRVNKKGFNSYTELYDHMAMIKGYDNSAEYWREWKHNTGRQSSIAERIDCSNHLGVYIAERKCAKTILSMIFEYVQEMPYGNPGFDFICKNNKNEFTNLHPTFKFIIDKEYKIDIKSSRLINNKWNFRIKFNNIADFFLIMCFNDEYDEDKLKPIHIWLIKKDKIIRDREFYKRERIEIINRRKYILGFIEYEVN